jgi:hypothetical protein
VARGVGEQLVEDDREPLRARGLQIQRIGVDAHLHRGRGGDGRHERVGGDMPSALLAEQVMHGSDSADALGGVVERGRARPLRAPEQQQVRHRLQAVLDPVMALGQQGVLELGASAGVSAARGLASRKAAEDDRQQGRRRQQRDAHRHLAGGESSGSERHHGEVREQRGSEPQAATNSRVHCREEGHDQEQQ